MDQNTRSCHLLSVRGSPVMQRHKPADMKGGRRQARWTVTKIEQVAPLMPHKTDLKSASLQETKRTKTLLENRQFHVSLGDGRDNHQEMNKDTQDLNNTINQLHRTDTRPTATHVLLSSSHTHVLPLSSHTCVLLPSSHTRPSREHIFQDRPYVKPQIQSQYILKDRYYTTYLFQPGWDEVKNL